MSEPTARSLRTADGLMLYGESLLPDGAPRAIVVIVHGYGEHLGRYRHVAAHLAARGYAVCALDHRGHGRSDGTRAYVDRFDQFVDDLHQFVTLVRAEHPDLKVFMFGHSMGALMSLAYALRYQTQLAGLIVSSAPVNADANVSPLLVKFAYAIDRVVPRLGLLPPEDPSVLTHDQAVLDALAADPLAYHGSLRVRLGLEIDRTARRVRDALPTLRLPILITYGEDDTYVNPSGSKLAYERVGSADKTLIGYDGLRHEMHNEPEPQRARVLDDIANWIDARSG